MLAVALRNGNDGTYGIRKKLDLIWVKPINKGRAKTLDLNQFANAAGIYASGIRRGATKMRRVGWLSIALVAVCLTLGACGKSDKVDTSKVEKSFSSAQPASKSAVDELKAAVAAKDYAKASAALQKLASSAKLTSDQRQAVDDVASQLKKKITEQAKQVAKDTDKALDDVQKQLPK